MLTGRGLLAGGGGLIVVGGLFDGGGGLLVAGGLLEEGGGGLVGGLVGGGAGLVGGGGLLAGGEGLPLLLGCVGESGADLFGGCSWVLKKDCHNMCKTDYLEDYTMKLLVRQVIDHGWLASMSCASIGLISSSNNFIIEYLPNSMLHIIQEVKKGTGSAFLH